MTASYTWPGDALYGEIDRLSRRIAAITLQISDLEQERDSLENKRREARSELARSTGARDELDASGHTYTSELSKAGGK